MDPVLMWVLTGIVGFIAYSTFGGLTLRVTETLFEEDMSQFESRAVMVVMWPFFAFAAAFYGCVWFIVWLGERMANAIWSLGKQLLVRSK